jgi:uncharacterized protein YcbX
MKVSELWRYPVKSTGGQSLAELDFDARGVVGDRRWATYDAEGRMGSGKFTRRFRRIDGLLDLASIIEDDQPHVTFADGTVVRGVGDHMDAALRVALDVPDLELREESETPHLDGASVHLVTTAALDWFRDQLPESEIEQRRFRPNLVIESGGFGRLEEDWIGRDLQLGTARLRVSEPTERCRMVGAPQGDLPDDNRILKGLGAWTNLMFGVYAEVIEPGTVRVGDDVVLD